MEPTSFVASFNFAMSIVLAVLVTLLSLYLALVILYWALKLMNMMLRSEAGMWKGLKILTAVAIVPQLLLTALGCYLGTETLLDALSSLGAAAALAAILWVCMPLLLHRKPPAPTNKNGTE